MVSTQAKKAPKFGEYLKKLNLDSLDSFHGDTPSTERSYEGQQLTSEEIKEARRQANRERDEKIMQEMAEVIQLDEARTESRRKLGLED